MTPDKPMTAEGIAKELYMHGKVSHLPWSYQFVVERIKQAENEAYEKAAKVVDRWTKTMWSVEELADHIRQLKHQTERKG